METILEEKSFNIGEIKIPDKKIKKFLRKRIRLNQNLLNFYFIKLQNAIKYKNIKISLFDNQIKINSDIYDIIGLFSNDSILLKSKEQDFFEVNIEFVYESFGIREFDKKGNVIIPKLSQLEVLNVRTLKRINNEDLEIEELEEA